MEIKNLLNKLADLRIAQREIEAQIDEIKPQVETYAQELESGTELKVEAGIFTVSKRRTWKYPAPIVQAEAELKDRKKEAEQTGQAEYSEKSSMVFKENKE